ncbi:MAG: type II toxin-antitoxin system RelE/ParE family toxin [Clostridiales bacterium]|nr:type II toxin-antitoxin system RelE/ParE family toxin [Clostridiales bacterium]
MKNNYTIKYLPSFSEDLNSILYYMKYSLKDKELAKNFYNEVKKKIELRLLNPESFEVYRKTIDGKYNWYRIYFNNYTIFYTIKDYTMEVSRIIYSKRNLKDLL